MTPLLPAVILAGGRARRMGGADKALLPLGGVRVIDHLLSTLRGQVGEIAINANGDPARWAGLGLPVLPDPVSGFPGPMAGVLAALNWARVKGATEVVTVAGDTPFLPADFVARLRAAGAPAAVAETGAPDGTGRLHPVCGVWPVDLIPDLHAALAAGERRMHALCKLAGAVPVRFDAARPMAFFNINTTQDLASAEALLTASDQPIIAPPGPWRS